MGGSSSPISKFVKETTSALNKTKREAKRINADLAKGSKNIEDDIEGNPIKNFIEHATKESEKFLDTTRDDGLLGDIHEATGVNLRKHNLVGQLKRAYVDKPAQAKAAMKEASRKAKQEQDEIEEEFEQREEQEGAEAEASKRFSRRKRKQRRRASGSGRRSTILTDKLGSSEDEKKKTLLGL